MNSCSSGQVLQCSLASLCQRPCSLKVICDSSQFAQWVGRVPVSEALNNKVKKKLHVHEWVAASLTFVYLSSFPSPHLKILTAKF